MSTSKDFPDYFHPEFKANLRKLTLNGTSEHTDSDNEDLVERFGATSFEKNNPPRSCYHFYCKPNHKSKRDPENRYGRTIIEGPTFNAKDVLAAVKNRLRTQSWTADNVMELPRKSKINWTYVQSVVSECLEAEHLRLFQYLCTLQQQNKNKQ